MKTSINQASVLRQNCVRRTGRQSACQLVERFCTPASAQCAIDWHKFADATGTNWVLQERLSLTTGSWTNAPQRDHESHNRARYRAGQVLPPVQTVSRIQP